MRKKLTHKIDLRKQDLPKRKRNSIPRFSKTDLWLDLKADIDEGLKPQQGVWGILTPEEMTKYHIKDLRACKRFVQAYLEEKGLPYQVERKNTHEGVVIGVKYEPVMKQRA